MMSAGPEANHENPRVAILIPCRDEAAAIAKVVQDFREALPDAAVFVYDNCSSDNTAAVAAKAGAIVRRESLPGKGNVVRRMFSDIEADVYVLVDGDDTYDATGAPAMVERLEDNYLDMIVGARVAASDSAYRAGHRFGNLMLTRLVAFLFGNRMRPVDSSSKLNTYRDGWRILKTIIKLAKEEKPFLVFGSLSVVFAFVSLLLAWPLLATYLETGLVPRLPTAILATGLMLLAFLTLACGAILDVVTLGRREVKRLSYLELPRYRRPRYRRFTDSQERPEIAVR